MLELPIPLLDTLERLDRSLIQAGDIPRRWTITFTKALVREHPEIVTELASIDRYRDLPVCCPERPAGHDDDPAMIRIDLDGDHFTVARYILAHTYRDCIRLPLDMYC